MRLIISSLSLRHPHLLFCCIISIFDFTWLFCCFFFGVIIIIIIIIAEFFIPLLTDGFSQESEWQSPQVSRTFLDILVDLTNAVLWMFSTFSHFQSSSPCTKPLVTVPSAPITISITVTFMSHNFFSSLAGYFTFHQFYCVVSWNTKVHYLACSLFLLSITWSARLAKIRWSIGISKFQRICASHFLGGFWIVHVPFVRMVKFKFLAHFPVDHLVDPVVSSLVLFLC